MRAVILLGLLLGTAPAGVSAVPAGFDRRAGELLAAGQEPSRPGAAAVVSANGRVLWTGAAGSADVAAGRPLEAGSLFRYASITKQFTAALVLKLVEEGRLGLDDELGRLLTAETPAAWHKVTVRQLLNHTSGIPSYTGARGFMVEANTARPHTTQQLIDVTRNQPLDFAPGSDWRYNNTGYVLLSAIIEKVTGKSWHAALRERITSPLGLSSIRCGCEPGTAVVEGYTEGGKPAQKIDMTVPSGAGALVGNAADLARWADALHGGRVLKPASYQAMIAETSLTTGRKVPYGFGLGSGVVRGMKTIGHNGGIFGFGSESLYAPEKKLFVAALSNSDVGEAPTIARRLLAEAAGVPFPRLTATKADMAALEPYLGLYKDEQGERRFFVKDGKLYTQRSGGSRFEVFAAGKDRFFYGPASLSYFDLARSADGTPEMRFHAEGAPDAVVARRAGPMPDEPATLVLTASELDRYVGAYAMGPAVMTIARSGDGLTGQLTGQRPIPLEAVASGQFRTVGVDATLSFVEEGGKIVRVVLNQGGRTIPFQRQ